MTCDNGRSGTARGVNSERSLTHSLDLTEEQAMTDRTCSIEGCEKPHRARGWCKMHYNRWEKHGDINVVLRPGNRPGFGSANYARWRGDAIGYSAAHMRVRIERGPASGFLCVCGAHAAHWAYDHTDPAEMHDQRGCPYSADPDHYFSLCTSCHKLFDRAVVLGRNT